MSNRTFSKAVLYRRTLTICVGLGTFALGIAICIPSSWLGTALV